MHVKITNVLHINYHIKFLVSNEIQTGFHWMWFPFSTALVPKWQLLASMEQNKHLLINTEKLHIFHQGKGIDLEFKFHYILFVGDSSPQEDNMRSAKKCNEGTVQDRIPNKWK